MPFRASCASPRAPLLTLLARKTAFCAMVDAAEVAGDEAVDDAELSTDAPPQRQRTTGYRRAEDIFERMDAEAKMRVETEAVAAETEPCQRGRRPCGRRRRPCRRRQRLP